MKVAVLSCLALGAMLTSFVHAGPWLPGTQPGKAKSKKSGACLTLSNAVISARWDAKTLDLLEVRNEAGQTVLQGPMKPFVIMVDGKPVAASEMTLAAPPRIEKISATPGAPNWARRSPGLSLDATFKDAEGRFGVEWKAVLRDGSNYVRQIIEIKPAKTIHVTEITLFDCPWTGKVSGTVKGSPIVSDSGFLALESPLAANTLRKSADGTRAVCSYNRNSMMKPGQSFACSSVVGVYPKRQLRRAFLYYVERERAHSYRQFLHYNTWYDLNIGRPKNRMTEAEALASINAIGTELVKKRGVDMDGFVLDDGWDSHTRVWGSHKGFPDGFAKIEKAARSYGAGVGVWMSPWGGYGGAKKERLKSGRATGLEINRSGFSMAGRNYRTLFEKTAVMMMKKYGVNYFKFDGMGGGGGSAADDINAILDMSLELREVNPNLWINATVGTWPSPFWTRYADSVWRQGEDVGFKGEGNVREKWITYRDTLTCERIVRGGPLFPLNSLMFHGVVIARRGPPAKMPLDEASVRHEIRAAFGCGSGLQELYITPKSLTKQMWDDIAASAKWSRARLGVLYDTHWVGGNPGKGEVYGWAAWSRGKGALTLRNPSSKEQSFQFDPQAAFELPAPLPGKIRLVSPYPDQRVRSLTAGPDKTPEVHLKPFEVLTFDAE